jgi:hypothetical protein
MATVHPTHFTPATAITQPLSVTLLLLSRKTLQAFCCCCLQRDTVHSNCGRGSQTSALDSEPRAHEGARRPVTYPNLSGRVWAIAITTRPAVNSSTR